MENKVLLIHVICIKNNTSVSILPKISLVFDNTNTNNFLNPRAVVSRNSGVKLIFVTNTILVAIGNFSG